MAFKDHAPGEWPHTTEPAIDGEAISYGSGDQTLTRASRAVYIGTAGHLVVTMRGGTQLTFSNLAAGSIYPISCTAIIQSGSTAAGLVLY